MKRYYLYFVFLFAAILLTFSVVNIASAIPIKTWNHEKVGIVEMNAGIDAYNSIHPTYYKNIVEEYWAINKTEVGGDSKNWEFDNLLNVEYLLIKAGQQIELFYVGDVGTGKFTWTGTHGISNFSTIAPVPEPATMLLLGTGLIALAAFKRRKSKKT